MEHWLPYSEGEPAFDVYLVQVETGGLGLTENARSQRDWLQKWKGQGITKDTQNPKQSRPALQCAKDTPNDNYCLGDVKKYVYVGVYVGEVKFEASQ